MVFILSFKALEQLIKDETIPQKPNKYILVQYQYQDTTADNISRVLYGIVQNSTETLPHRLVIAGGRLSKFSGKYPSILLS